MDKEKNRKKVVCPKCNSDKVAYILYGLPTPEAMEEAKKGKWYLGGCILGDHFYHCWNCQHEW